MSDKQDILALPTGTCFDDALYILLEFTRYKPTELANLTIIHALCNMHDKISAHAWIETKEGCIFNAIVDGEKVTLMASPHEDYYETINVIERKTYTPKQFFKFFQKTDHTGPWSKRYRMHCKDYQ